MTISKPFREDFVKTQGWGEHPDWYAKFGLKGHNGDDWACPTATTIISCDDGTVSFIGDDPTGYGHYIKVVHSWGESLYAHLQNHLVTVGFPVKRGQAIGVSDNTGNSSGPHLHFGIRINPYNKGDGYSGYSDPTPYYSSNDSTNEGGTMLPTVLVKDVIKAIYRKMIGQEIPDGDLANEEAKQPFSVEETIGRFMSPDFLKLYDLHTSIELVQFGKENYDKGFADGKATIPTEGSEGPPNPPQDPPPGNGTPPTEPSVPGVPSLPMGDNSGSLLQRLLNWLRDFFTGKI